MQETNYNNQRYQEFFEDGENVYERMNRRLDALAGHTLVRRVHIGRNDLCPCDSGKKFKRCCIDKIQKYED